MDRQDLPEKKSPAYTFADPLTRGERIALMVYFPLHIVLLPSIISIVSYWLGFTLDDTTINVVYYAVGFIYMLVALRGYFRRAFDELIDARRRCATAFLLAYLIDIGLSWAAEAVFAVIPFDFSSSPNNDFVFSLADVNFGAVFAMSVFMAPMVEEPMFRGLLFGSVRKHGRVAAYAVSVAVFSVYHVWQYAVLYADWTYLVYALSYVPVSFALAWSYEKSGSIWVPVFFHMAVNAISMYVIYIM